MSDIYRVLWVEDNDVIVDSTRLMADRFDLELVRFSNWDDAKGELETNFENYTAIILDAMCKIHRENLETESFVPVVLPKLYEIFIRNQKYIPWYILSAGTMHNFEFVISAAEEIRADFADKWGYMCFSKDAPEEDPKSMKSLFLQIRKIGETQYLNSVLYKHRDVFAYLGNDKLISYPTARDYMLKMLEMVYSTEDKSKYQFEGIHLRHVLEYLFRAAREKGLLPEECFIDSGVIMRKASMFMAGRAIKCNIDNEPAYRLRWGKAGEGRYGMGGDYIFDSFTAKCVENILEYANASAHGVVKDDAGELFSSCVMQLCRVICDFGKFVEEHPDPEANRAMHNRIMDNCFSSENVVGKVLYILTDGNVFYVGPCKLSPECCSYVRAANRVVIDEVVENTDKDKGRFPFIATRITPVPEW